VILSDKEEIFELIQMFFEAGKTKDFSILRKIQVDSPEFSSFSDVPPYGLQNYSDSVALEELRFSSISDYNFELKNPKISILDAIGIITFLINQTGMLVDNKAFTGQHITINGRATFVLIKKPTWKIIHYHLDKISN
jgi:ketosteroid isomerase-like protein|tara:strand:- start:281 stop:691 length:411 start_codon:yes stop_codon:yes gene_type:complete